MTLRQHPRPQQEPLEVTIVPLENPLADTNFITYQLEVTIGHTTRRLRDVIYQHLGDETTIK